MDFVHARRASRKSTAVAGFLKALQLVYFERPVRLSPARVREVVASDPWPSQRGSRANAKERNEAGEAVVGARLPICSGGKR